MTIRAKSPSRCATCSTEAYTDLPTAFKYRSAIDMNASCRVTPPSDGKLITTTVGDGQSRAMIEVQGVSFPLPLRDPRGQIPVPAVVEAVQTASPVDVPLPRPRPAGQVKQRPALWRRRRGKLSCGWCSSATKWSG
ncbi:DUF2865 domain-containing protein [Devosia sp. A8/3-2]|nr:DUF2865 domain-containing protein [Devosia sp. A8/3-2]